jgi:hypothetical protein
MQISSFSRLTRSVIKNNYLFQIKYEEILWNYVLSIIYIVGEHATSFYKQSQLSNTIKLPSFIINILLLSVSVETECINISCSEADVEKDKMISCAKNS